MTTKIDPKLYRQAVRALRKLGRKPGKMNSVPIDNSGFGCVGCGCPTDQTYCLGCAIHAAEAANREFYSSGESRGVAYSGDE